MFEILHCNCCFEIRNAYWNYYCTYFYPINFVENTKKKHHFNPVEKLDWNDVALLLTKPELKIQRDEKLMKQSVKEI